MFTADYVIYLLFDWGDSYAIAMSIRDREDPKRNSQISSSNGSSKTLKKKKDKCVIS